MKNKKIAYTTVTPSSSMTVKPTVFGERLRLAMGMINRNEDNASKIGSGQVNLNGYYEKLFLTVSE
jgi:hypothetical protein